LREIEKAAIENNLKRRKRMQTFNEAFLRTPSNASPQSVEVVS